MQLRIPIAAALSIAILATPAASVAQSDGVTHVVATDGSGDFDTISAAAAIAADGDTILVGPGTYVEAVVIDKDITLSGDGDIADIVIQAPVDGPISPIDSGFDSPEPFALLLDESNATVSGLTFRGREAAIHAVGGAPTFDGLVLDAVGWQDIGGGGSLSVMDSDPTVRDSSFLGGGNIWFYGDSTLTVEGNTFLRSFILADEVGAGSVIAGNTFNAPARQGMLLFSGESVLIEGNTLNDVPEVGIYLGWETGDGFEATIRGNTINGAGHKGMWISSGADPLIEGNAITGADVGIYIEGDSPVLTGNTITRGRTGLYVLDDATPILTGNTVCDNSMANVTLSAGAEIPDMADNEICP